MVHDFSGRGHTGATSGSGVSIGATGSGKFYGGYVANTADDGGHINAGVSDDFDFALSGGAGFSFFTWFNKVGPCDSPDNDNEVMASRYGTGDRANTWWFGCGFDDAGEGSYDNKLVLQFYPENQPEVILSSGNSINDGNWHHGGWVYDPVDGDVTLYLDGQPVSSLSSSPGPFTSSEPLCFGAYGDNCDSYEYVGSLDEAAVFNRALGAGEVNNLYQRGVVSLGVSVRACNDGDCSDADFVALDDRNPQGLSFSGRYFQYRFDFGPPSWCLHAGTLPCDPDTQPQPVAHAGHRRQRCGGRQRPGHLYRLIRIQCTRSRIQPCLRFRPQRNCGSRRSANFRRKIWRQHLTFLPREWEPIS